MMVLSFGTEVCMSIFDDVIHKCHVCLGLTGNNGTEIISQMVESAASRGVISQELAPKVIRALLKREMSASTAMPDGIALPHTKTDFVEDIVCIIGVHPLGIEFGAPDGQPTRLFFLMLIPFSKACSHIEFLAQLSRSLQEPDVRTMLLGAQSRDDVIRAILSHVDEGAL